MICPFAAQPLCPPLGSIQTFDASGLLQLWCPALCSYNWPLSELPPSGQGNVGVPCPTPDLRQRTHWHSVPIVEFGMLSPWTAGLDLVTLTFGLLGTPVRDRAHEYKHQSLANRQRTLSKAISVASKHEPVGGTSPDCS